MEKYSAETLMPFGRYAGSPLKSVPKHYLLWYYKSTAGRPALRGTQGSRLCEYIKKAFNEDLAESVADHTGAASNSAGPADYSHSINHGMESNKNFSDMSLSTLKKYDDLVGSMMDCQERYFSLRKSLPRENPEVIKALESSKHAESAVRKFRKELQALLNHK